MVWQFLEKLKYTITAPFLGIDPKEMKVWTKKEVYTHMFIAALFTIAKNGRNPSAHQQTNG